MITPQSASHWYFGLSTEAPPMLHGLRLLDEFAEPSALPTPRAISEFVPGADAASTVFLPVFGITDFASHEVTPLRHSIEQVADDVNRGATRLVLDRSSEAPDPAYARSLRDVVRAAGVTNLGNVLFVSQNRRLSDPDAPLPHRCFDYHPIVSWRACADILGKELSKGVGLADLARRAPEYDVLCLNATARFHRLLLVLELAHSGLVDLAAPDYSTACKIPYVSFLGFDFREIPRGTPRDAASIVEQLVAQGYDHLAPLVEPLLSRLPLEIDRRALRGLELTEAIELEHYRNTKISVIAETDLSNEMVRVTEKTLKAMALGHPFVTIGCRHSLDVAREYGYGLFEDVVDHRYNHMALARDRLRGAVSSAREFVDRYKRDPVLRGYVHQESLRNLEWTMEGFSTHYAERFAAPILEFCLPQRASATLGTVDESGGAGVPVEPTTSSGLAGLVVPDYTFPVETVRCKLESALRIDNWILVHGWSANHRYDLVVGNRRLSLHPGAPQQTWTPRADVAHLLATPENLPTGFVALVALDRDDHEPSLLVAIADGSTAVATTPLRGGPSSTVDRIGLILGTDTSSPTLRDRFTKIGAPYVDALDKDSVAWRTAYDNTADDFTAPIISLVVPFFGNEHLLSLHFALIGGLNPNVREELEIIIVNDKPDDDLSGIVTHHAVLYGVRTRLLAADENCGFARAVMAGARHARGEFLLILNSDCFFSEPMQIFDLADDLATHHDIGAVAPLLLREDGSIDHLGMQRMHLPGRDTPFFEHIGAGHPLSSAPRERLVPCRYLTGACLMLRTDEFLHRFGGFPTFSWIGDFEDAALSDVITKHGARLAVNTTAHATHFVRTSFESFREDSARTLLSWFNAWRYDEWTKHELSSGGAER